MQHPSAVRGRMDPEGHSPRPFPIVGIGVSVEGSEAVDELLGAIPQRSGMAYVVVQRAVSSQQGIVARALGEVTAMPVIEAADGSRVRPDQVYLLPPGANFALRDGVLRRLPASLDGLPIDRFFGSLARDRRELARGVALSGVGIDATQGLLAIRAEGGIAFAQDPASARFDDIPRHAIEAHVVDFVLPPVGIARQLIAQRSEGASSGAHAGREQRHGASGDVPVELADEIDRIVFHRYRLAAVVCDARFNVMRFHGRTGFYLEPAAGEPSRNLVSMARPGLAAELQQVLEQALRDDAAALRQDVPVEGAGGLELVSIEAVPITLSGSATRQLLVLFSRASAPPLAASTDAAQPAQWEEELRVANDELRSMNDELLQSREELQYTADELQRRNAELARTNETLARAIRLASATRDHATTLLDAVPLPIAIVNPTLRIEAANRAFHEFFGLALPLEPDCRLLELSTDEATRDELRTLLPEAFERGIWLRDVELEYPLARSGVRTVLLSGCLIASERGGPALLLVLLDVTERKRREQERLRLYTEGAQRFLNEAGRLLLAEPLESSSMLEKLARFAVPQLGDLCVIDLVGEDRGIRPVAARAGSEEVPALDAIAARMAPDADDVVAEVVRTGGSVLSPRLDDKEHALDPRRRTWLRGLGASSYLCVPLPGRRGVLGALTLARTHRAQPYGREDLALAEGLAQRVGLALENAQLYRDAREVIRVRDEFMGIASHELRTPLTALSLQLETLRNLLDDGPAFPQGGRAREKIARALTQVGRLGRLIDSLLVVSRITAGVLTLQRDEVDLSEIVRDVVQRLHADADRAGSAIEVRTAEPVRGHWDPLRLEQLVTNLLANALRHAPGHPVSVRVESDAERARLLVQDRGPGIAPERWAQIFERFETASTPSSSGLGLGLYIARQIAEAHGGTIEVQSELGSGSTFVVELPVK